MGKGEGIKPGICYFPPGYRRNRSGQRPESLVVFLLSQRPVAVPAGSH
jgi:hypothetical protein